ncbi:MAG: pseudouridine synthase [Chromatiales bacterium]|nr:pseudouridine synthase [Chromatiales bacterium]
MARVVILNKPYNVLSQFTDERHSGPARETLKRFIPMPGLYPAGRLDLDSEGLLVLTDDGGLNHRLSHPTNKVTKTYWVQVEGAPHDHDLQPLREGAELRDGVCRPARCALMETPWLLWPREPPIRVRQHLPTQWISVTIAEGRNRQVRRMCAAVGFPALRLIRYRVGSWTIDGLEPGGWRQVV